MKVQCSIIIPVLESYEVVGRQILHFNKILPNNWELLIMDDGSIPSIRSQLNDIALKILNNENFQLIETNDFRSWSQPAASNTAARLAKGEYLLHTDVDHIITKEAIESVIWAIPFKKMIFHRVWGILDENGDICTDNKVLMEYGLPKERIGHVSSHSNTWAMPRDIFFEIGGYTEKIIPEHGGDDNRLNDAYGKLARPNEWKTLLGTDICVYPNPREDKRKIFHRLRDHKIKTGSYARYSDLRMLNNE